MLVGARKSMKLLYPLSMPILFKKTTEFKLLKPDWKTLTGQQ